MNPLLRGVIIVLVAILVRRAYSGGWPAEATPWRRKVSRWEIVGILTFFAGAFSHGLSEMSESPQVWQSLGSALMVGGLVMGALGGMRREQGKDVDGGQTHGPDS